MMQTKSATAEVSEQQIIADINYVADTIGRPPNSTEYKEIGRHCLQTALNRLGPDWAATLQKAGYDPTDARLGRIPDDELKDDLLQVAAEIGHPPRKTDYKEHGEFSPSSALRRGPAPGWDSTLEWAGLNPESRPNDHRMTDEELIADLRMGALALGHSPSSTEINRYGEYSSSTYIRRWDCYENALAAAGLPAAGEDLDDDTIREFAAEYDLAVEPEDVPMLSKENA